MTKTKVTETIQLKSFKDIVILMLSVLGILAVLFVYLLLAAVLIKAVGMITMGG